MEIKWVLVFSSVVLAVSAASTGEEFWKGTALDKMVEKMRSACDERDTLACFQYKALTFVANLLKGNLFKVILVFIFITFNQLLFFHYIFT